MPTAIDPQVNRQHEKGSVGRDFILPILAWVALIIAFSNVKHIPFDFSDKNAVVIRYLAKVIVTIIFPLGLIHLIYKNKSDFGIYFPKYSESFKLSLKAFSLAGPACITFLLIGIAGWEFGDWKGGAALSIAFLLVLYFMPGRTNKLPTRESINAPDKRIILVTALSLLTVLVAYFLYGTVPVVPKILYYVFIVGFGEELFFRGYFQSSLNRYLGRPYTIGKVQFGWGLFLAAAVFGLSHALVTVPPTWPWAVWTLILGLTLGYIREKDGSILAAAMLHAMVDFPLAFMS